MRKQDKAKQLQGVTESVLSQHSWSVMVRYTLGATYMCVQQLLFDLQQSTTTTDDAAASFVKGTCTILPLPQISFKGRGGVLQGIYTPFGYFTALYPHA